MSAVEKTPPEANKIINGVTKLLEKLKIKEGDFKEKLRGKYIAHERIIDELTEKWRATNGFGEAIIAYSPKGGTYGIDFLGREFERGRILLAVEVDSWFRTVGSWMKLSDIRSKNKIWIYITDWEEDKARQNFGEAINEIKALLRSRKEDKVDFGNFVAFMKTPDVFQPEVIFLTT